jgi:ABC-2 type transport system ATP-binding protein
MTGAAIRVRGIRKAYGDQEVLKGIDLDVERGSSVALLGSNGAGKTTLVRILSTLLRADAGDAEIHGIDVAARAGRVREIISLTGQLAAVVGGLP